MDKKNELRKLYSEEHPERYEDIVKAVVKLITDNKYPRLDPERIHVIGDGDYQGTLLFVIGAKEYQPRDYWCVFVDYGSCSGCDTLEAIHETVLSNKPPTQQQTDDYMSLALHIVQNITKIG